MSRRASPGPTRDITAEKRRPSWRPSTAGRSWSLSGISTTPNITTCGSASPGIATVSQLELPFGSSVAQTHANFQRWQKFFNFPPPCACLLAHLQLAGAGRTRRPWASLTGLLVSPMQLFTRAKWPRRTAWRCTPTDAGTTTTACRKEALCAVTDNVSIPTGRE